MAFHTTSEPRVALTGHLEELRTRLLTAILALVAGCAVGWWLYPTAYHLVAAAVLDSVTAHGGIVVMPDPTEGFYVQVKMSAVLGLVLASPIILWQLWGFIAPGLTAAERRAAAPLVPVVCLLFLIGAGVALLLMPAVMQFFLGFTPTGVHVYLDFQHSINLPLKVILAFGLAFQLPLAVLGLVLLRVISPQLLLHHWRMAVVVLSVLAAVITPTWDIFSMLIMLVPLVILYFGTVFLAFRLVREPAPVINAGEHA